MLIFSGRITIAKKGVLLTLLIFVKIQFETERERKIMLNQ